MTNTQKRWLDRRLDVVHAYCHELKTYAEIGEQYNVTRARIGQIIGESVSPKMRKHVRRKRSLHRRRRTCPVCGMVFIARHSSDKTAAGKPRMCSRKCYAHSQRKWTDEALLQLLVDLHKELGYTPGVVDLLNHSPPGHSIYYQRFGSLRRAQELAGLTPNAHGTFSKQRVAA
jgi:ribosomal protein S27AE